jgi:hypothetical protein
LAADHDPSLDRGDQESFVEFRADDSQQRFSRTRDIVDGARRDYGIGMMEPDQKKEQYRRDHPHNPGIICLPSPHFQAGNCGCYSFDV